MVNWKVSTGLAILMLVYILVGALVFYALEHNTYTPVDITDSQFYKDFLANNPSVASADLENFTRAVVKLISDSEEVVVAENVTEKTNGWTYDNAIYFTITVVSTIGYGHISPKTVGGKWFCIFFALVGIPMAVALLAVVGSKLKVITDRLHKRTRSLCPSNPARDRQIKSVAVLTAGMVLMLCIPALVFSRTEDWDYLTALYYATITLTTVGFGDYVAGGGIQSNTFRILLCLWLVVGLAFVALVVSEASELYSRSGSSGEKEDSRDDARVESSEFPEATKDPESHVSPVLHNGNTASVDIKL